ncbi:MAG: TraR/DksA family transcriptional regulator [Acidobacteriota bacterium]
MPQSEPAEVQQADSHPLRQRLEQRREQILDLYNSDLKAGQASADEGTDDIVDRANNSYNREFLFSLSNNERAMLVEVDEAIARMDEGTYGSCLHCQREIGSARLEAVPWAKLCIDCQELKEQGMLPDMN